MEPSVVVPVDPAGGGVLDVGDDALIKLLYLVCREMGRTTRAGRGGRSNYNWKIAMNQFDVMFPGRLDNS